MNCKLLIISFLALCCIQLILAAEKNPPKLRRSRSGRRIRTTVNSSKSLKKSPSLKQTVPAINFSTTKSTPSNDDKMKILEHLNNSLEILDGGKPNVTENYNVAENIPIQPAKKSVLIEGRNNEILVDGVVKYSNAFSNGDVQIKIRDGDFYVNNNLVLRKASSRDTGKFVIYSKHTFGYKEVTWFMWKIDPSGRWSYKDNKRDWTSINYYTDVNF